MVKKSISEMRNLARAWAQLIVKSWVDEDFKQELLKNPKKVFADNSLSNLPYDLKVHENTAHLIHLVLLQDLSKELSEAEIRSLFQRSCLHGGTIYDQEWEGAHDNEVWTKVMLKAWADQKFKKRLLENPTLILKEERYKIPEGISYQVHENTDTIRHFTLLVKRTELLSEESLKTVGSAGFMTGRATSSLCTGISTPPNINE